MTRYRKIDPRIWNDAKFADLSDGAKLLFLFLLTHPSLTLIGAMRATTAGLAAELHWTSKAFGEAFGEALAKGLIEHDERRCCIVIPNFAKYNPPQSPNVCRSVPECLQLLPECVAVTRQLRRFYDVAKGIGKAFAEAFAEAFPKALPNQEQEQEQEQEYSEAEEKKSESKGEMEDVEIPPSLRSPKFLEAWANWKKHRIEIRKPVKPAAAKQQLKKCAGWGIERAVSAIENSIAGSYQGIFEDRNGKPNLFQQPQPQQRIGRDVCQ